MFIRAALALASIWLLGCGSGTEGSVAGPVFVYAGSSTNIHAFALDRQTGALTAQGTVPAGDDARLAEVDVRRRRVYVQTQLGTPLALLTFEVSSGRGALTRAGERPLPHPNVEGVTQLILHPQEPWLLLSATNSSPGLEDQLMPIAADGTPGAAKVISQEFYGFAWDPSGRYFYGLDGEAIFQYAFDAAAGTITPNDPPHAAGSGGRTVLGLQSHPAGRWVYAVEEGVIGQFSFDPQTGLLRGEAFLENPIPAEPIYWTSLVVHQSGRFLYALGYLAGSRLALLDLFSIDPASGRLRFVKREAGYGTHELTHTGLQAPLLIGDLLLVGGQGAADPVRGRPIIASYRIDRSVGTLTPLGRPIELAPARTGTVSFLFSFDP